MADRRNGSPPLSPPHPLSLILSLAFLLFSLPPTLYTFSATASSSSFLFSLSKEKFYPPLPSISTPADPQIPMLQLPFPQEPINPFSLSIHPQFHLQPVSTKSLDPWRREQKVSVFLKFDNYKFSDLLLLYISVSTPLASIYNFTGVFIYPIIFMNVKNQTNHRGVEPVWGSFSFGFFLDSEALLSVCAGSTDSDPNISMRSLFRLRASVSGCGVPVVSVGFDFTVALYSRSKAANSLFCLDTLIRISGVPAPAMGTSPASSLIATGNHLRVLAKLFNLITQMHQVVERSFKVNSNET